MSNLPEIQQDQVITNLLHKKATTLTGKSGHQKDVDLKLSTKGSMARVTLNPVKRKPVYFSEHSISELQSILGYSNNGTKKMAHWLRVHGGRKILPPYLRSHVTSEGKSMENIYHLKYMEFDVGNGKMEKRPVFYGNATEVVEAVMEKREIIDPCFIKVMADSGQGSFKISISIIPHNYDPELDQILDGQDLEIRVVKKSRTTCAEGGSCKKGKITGVKRLILLANVPDIKETFQNCQKLWKLIDLDQISYLFFSRF